MDKVLNFRDPILSLDKTSFSSSVSKLNHGLVYRGAHADEATDIDVKRFAEMNIRTIIDLRSGYEPIKSDLLAEQYPLTVFPEPEPEEYDSEYEKRRRNKRKTIKVNLNGRSFHRYLMANMTWMQFFQTMAYFCSCQKKKAARLIGDTAVKPRGLGGMYVAFVNGCHNELRTVLDIVADKNNLPLFINCTHGKDRTGFIIAVLLSLCGVDDEAIVFDYSLSQKGLRPLYDEIVRNLSKIGLTEEFAAASPDAMRTLLQYVHEEYGSMSEYLTAIGYPLEKQEQIRRNLMHDTALQMESL